MERSTSEQIQRRRAAAVGVLILVVVFVIAGIGSCGSKETNKIAVYMGKKPVGPTATVNLTDQQRESLAIDQVLDYTPFISRGSPRKREVALTFDDGPGPYTPEVLKILKKFNVPATFFVVGQQMTDFGDVFKDELAGGFTIGNHTENHPQMNTLSRREQLQQLSDGTAQIRKFGGDTPRLFRPPYRLYNANTLKLIKKLNMLMVLWSVDTEDYRQPGVNYIVNAAVKGARPGAIILMHDGGGDRSQTVAALPTIIRKLRAKGYTLVSVPRLVLDDPPPRNQPLPTLPSGGGG